METRKEGRKMVTERKGEKRKQGHWPLYKQFRAPHGRSKLALKIIDIYTGFSKT